MKALVAIASAAGYIDPVMAPETGRPQALRIGGNGVRLRFTTALSKTQELENLSRLTQFGEIGQFLAGPETWQLKGKTEQMLQYAAELLNVKTGLLRTEEEAKMGMDQMRSALAAGAGEGQRRLSPGLPQSGVV